MSEKNKAIHDYDDIINLPRHVSSTHPQMAISDRAAQFAPFAALSGYDSAIKETARLTDEKTELDENEKEFLDEKLMLLQKSLSQHPEITVTYFQPDEKKAGGKYNTVTGIIKKIDMYDRFVVMSEDLKIPLNNIFEIEGDIFADICEF